MSNPVCERVWDQWWLATRPAGDVARHVFAELAGEIQRLEGMGRPAVEADLYPDDHEWSARLYHEHRWAWNRAVLIRGEAVTAGDAVFFANRITLY